MSRRKIKEKVEKPPEGLTEKMSWMGVIPRSKANTTREKLYGRSRQRREKKKRRVGGGKKLGRGRSYPSVVEKTA